MIRHTHGKKAGTGSLEQGRVLWKEFVSTSQFQAWKRYLHEQHGHILVVEFDDQNVCTDVFIKKVVADS